MEEEHKDLLTMLNNLYKNWFFLLETQTSETYFVC